MESDRGKVDLDLGLIAKKVRDYDHAARSQEQGEHTLCLSLRHALTPALAPFQTSTLSRALAIAATGQPAGTAAAAAATSSSKGKLAERLSEGPDLDDFISGRELERVQLGNTATLA